MQALCMEPGVVPSPLQTFQEPRDLGRHVSHIASRLWAARPPALSWVDTDTEQRPLRQAPREEGACRVARGVGAEAPVWAPPNPQPMYTVGRVLHFAKTKDENFPNLFQLRFSL